MCPRGGRFFVDWMYGLMELKPPTTFADQVNKLRSRNCIIENDSECIRFLEQVNYYRFSAYFLPFKQKDGFYIAGTSFRKIQRIYEFDQKMRILIIGALEDIELHLRTQFAYYYTHTYGSDGYLNKENFRPNYNHEKFIKLMNSQIHKHKETLVVKHHTNKYDSIYPMWVVIEMLPLGMLSRLYQGFKMADQKAIAEIYNVPYVVLKSWLQCITELRNICAHYGRLYYWRFTSVPAIPKNSISKIVPGRSLFDQMVMLQRIYPDKKKRKSRIFGGLWALLEEYKDDIDLSHTGFPNDWGLYLA